VLGDLFQIPGEHLDRFIDLDALVVAECGDCWCRGVLQFIEQFNRQLGEVIDEVERVLVCRPGR
jgi:hypothetical protein